MKKLVLGFCGPNGSGKGVVINFLERESIALGFNCCVKFSLSDCLRREIIERNGPSFQYTRNDLISVGNSLRKERGHGFLGEMAVTQTLNNFNSFENDASNSVVSKQLQLIDSIRTLGEVSALRKGFSKEKDVTFRLVSIDAPTNIRFDRCKLRNRDSDSSDFDLLSFIKNDDMEQYGLANTSADSAAYSTYLTEYDANAKEKSVEEESSFDGVQNLRAIQLKSDVYVVNSYNTLDSLETNLKKINLLHI